MNMPEIIRKTKNRIPLTEEEITALVQGVTEESIPLYQISAWLMAVCLMGMTDAETVALTRAMRDSGECLHWETLPHGKVVDKHSTGGVGDKTTIILAPILAACGLYMPKMSGRGLGFTGGTIDKLESIPGLRTDLTPEQFLHLTEKVGFSIAQQTESLAPADKQLYALRDVTETVDSIPLICASIMSKKLADGADHLLLDVKVGSGAFMKNRADAQKLADLMQHIAREEGKSCSTMLTEMDIPLGRAIGNAIEIREAISVLQGDWKNPLGELCVELAARLMSMAQCGTEETCSALAIHALTSGEALTRLQRMIEGQGGDPRVTEQPELLPTAHCQRTLYAKTSGKITAMHCEAFGRAAVLLGAGRSRKEDTIDPAAGILLHAVRGDFVQKGDPLFTLYAASEAQLDLAEKRLSAAVV